MTVLKDNDFEVCMQKRYCAWVRRVSRKQCQKKFMFLFCLSINAKFYPFDSLVERGSNVVGEYFLFYRENEIMSNVLLH